VVSEFLLCHKHQLNHLMKEQEKEEDEKSVVGFRKG
jgi:hypothetical protein